MIKANDLRLGNWIHTKMGFERIGAIGKTYAYKTIGWDYYEDINPIPITPEILHKIKDCREAISDEKWSNVEGFGKFAIYSHPSFDIRATNGSYELIHLESTSDGFMAVCPTYGIVFKFLHELQNWAALTGTELSITL